MSCHPIECFYNISQYPYHHQVKNTLVDAINSAAAQPLKTNEQYGSDITRTDWSMSEDFTRRWVNIFSEFLLDHIDKIYSSMGYETYSINQIWFQQYEHLNSKHAWHSHGCCFTNVYYLEFPENSPKTEFIIPYGQCTKNRIVKQFDVTEGSLLVFPSFVIHRAPPLQNTHRKTIISFNVDVGINSEDYAI